MTEPVGVVLRAYAEVEGRQIHYRHAGDPANPTLLLLHQSPSSSAMYTDLMTALADRFFLVAPDSPGFGLSDPLCEQELTIAGLAASIHGLVQGLGLAPCGVFGHHTGAAIAVQLEHDFPGTASAMALSGPPLLDGQQQRELPNLASPLPPQANGEHLLAMWQRIRAKDPDAPLALSQREVLSALACGDAYQQSYLAVSRQDFAGLLGAVRCPVLVFAGDQDPLHGAVAPTLERLQQGSTVELAGGERTYVCERQVEQVAAVLADFFADQTRTEEARA